MREYGGLWFPDDEPMTEGLRARLDEQAVYRGDRLFEALGQVNDWFRAVECGAHVGMWTRVLADRFERVIAIEPDATNVECLRANTAHAANVSVHHAALGEIDGRASIAWRKGHMSAHVVKDGAEVPMMRLDALRIERCGYLKVHVNGYEWPVLRGAVDTIRRCRPVLTVVFKKALERYGYTGGEMLAWILAQGYRPAHGQDPYKVFVPA